MAKKGPGEFARFLATKSAGDTVTFDEILAAVPSWKESSLKTYFRKNKLTPFLATTASKNTYRVVRNGSTVTEADVTKALSQVDPESVTLVKNDVLVGELGRYTLIREVGAGAVGHVWAATSSATGSTVAIKVCSPRPDLLKPDVFDNVKERFGERLASARGSRMTRSWRTSTAAST
ncbi:Hypothetical protein I5071_55960 [Sandaracinus amylolyticus]|nr:Hypothetical protein I5071_55960 [Sandaracinus amylolyticus]